LKPYKYSELSERAKQFVRLELFEKCKQAEIDYSWSPIIYEIKDLENLIYRNNDYYEFNGEVFSDLS